MVMERRVFQFVEHQNGNRLEFKGFIGLIKWVVAAKTKAILGTYRTTRGPLEKMGLLYPHGARAASVMSQSSSIQQSAIVWNCKK